MLHIINKSPFDRPALDSALKVGEGAIIFIEDGVYAVAKGGSAEAKLKAAAGKFKFYALTPDLEARGLTDRVTDGVTAVDYAGFVDLVAEYKTNQSWL